MKANQAQGTIGENIVNTRSNQRKNESKPCKYNAGPAKTDGNHVKKKEIDGQKKKLNQKYVSRKRQECHIFEFLDVISSRFRASLFFIAWWFFWRRKFGETKSLICEVSTPKNNPGSERKWDPESLNLRCQKKGL